MKLQNLLFNDEFTLSTDYSIKEVRSSIHEVIEPREFFRFNAMFGNEPEKPYLGEAHGSRFDINRITSSRSIILPVIRGEMKPYLDKTLIHITMRLSNFSFWVIGCLILWFIWQGINSLIETQDYHEYYMNFQFPGEIRLVGAVLLSGYLISILLFIYESYKSKKFLLDLLDAEEIENIEDDTIS